MICVEYDNIYKNYKDADKIYDNILEKKAKLYFSTQPKSVDLTKEVVDGGITVDKFGLYVEKLEQLDIDLQKIRNDRDINIYLLKKKQIEYEEEIKRLEVNSIELDKEAIYNLIYYFRFIKHFKVRHIASKVNYSTRRTYEILEEIKSFSEKR